MQEKTLEEVQKYEKQMKEVVPKKRKEKEKETKQGKIKVKKIYVKFFSFLI